MICRGVFWHHVSWRHVAIWAAAAAIVIAALRIGGVSSLKEHLRALWFPNADRPNASGPFTVGRHDVTLEVGRWGRTVVTIWYPAGATRPSMLARATGRLLRPTSAAAVMDAPWPDTGTRFPLILHFPSWFARRSEVTFTLAELASHGFVVAAVDDIVHLRRLAPPDGDGQAASFSFASPEAFEASRALARMRTETEARFGYAMIDALLEQPSIGEHLDASRIGVSGFSFGGAAALELSRLDARVRAVVNLDGLILGAVETEGVRIPYLFLSSDTAPPTAEELCQLDLASRLDRMVDGEVLAFQRQQSERPNNYTVFIPAAIHTDFTDRLLMPAFIETLKPRNFNRVETWLRINQHLRSFFETHLLRMEGGRLPGAARPIPCMP